MDEVAPRRDEDQSGRRRPWFGLLLAAALLTSGVGAWMLGEPPDRSSARVLGPPGPDGQPTEANPPINPGARDPRDIKANNSPTVARNPKNAANLVVANRIDRPSFSCALHASFDFGSSWQPVTVPFPAGEEDPPRCFAPDVAYASDGTLHMSFVTLKGTGNVPNALWVVSSEDGGRTLSTPVKAAGPLTFQVQLTADASQPDRLYLNWLQAEATGSLLFPETGYPIVSSTSIDGGATWSAPVRVSPPSRQRVVAPSPVMAPSGELFVLYLDLLEDRLDYGGAHEGRGGEPYEGPWALVLARSRDQGTTWEEALVDGEIRPTERFIVFLPPTPSLAIDQRSGRLYVAFTDGRAGDADVNLWTSADGGRTFTPPLRVNDTRVGDGTSQYLPRLDVAPTGRVDVLYFDRRSDPEDVMNEVSLQSSFDQGRTFTRRVRVSNRSFDSRVGPGSERGLPDLGSRMALISTNQRALAVWTDTRGGTEITSKQDLASAVVEIPPPAAASRSWLRVVGAVAVLLGLLSLVLTLRARRASRGVVLYDPTVARPAPAPRRGRFQPAPPPPADPIPAPAPPPGAAPEPVAAPHLEAPPGASPEPWRAPHPAPEGCTPAPPPSPPGGADEVAAAAEPLAPQTTSPGSDGPREAVGGASPAEAIGGAIPHQPAPPWAAPVPEPPLAPQPPAGPGPAYVPHLPQAPPAPPTAPQLTSPMPPEPVAPDAPDHAPQQAPEPAPAAGEVAVPWSAAPIPPPPVPPVGATPDAARHEGPIPVPVPPAPSPPQGPTANGERPDDPASEKRDG